MCKHYIRVNGVHQDSAAVMFILTKPVENEYVVLVYFLSALKFWLQLLHSEEAFEII